MNRLRAMIQGKRMFLTMAVFLAVVAIYVASLPKAEAIAGPSICVYYSSATFKKVVGTRGTGCCGEVFSSGVTSPYVKCERLLCTQSICPN